jgi:adenylate cyclase
MTTHTLTVLVVEDVEETYDRFSDYLAQEGFSVIGASDGVEAVELAASLQPDVILMDLSLPRCDGLEATRRIKEDPRTRHIPVLAVTGHSERRVIELAHRVGCDAFLNKPCALDDVLAEIRRVLPGTTSGPRHVMIVEDDEEVRNVLAEILREEGFVVDAAGNGQEALEKLRTASKKPQLILLDLMMPVMDGWQFRAAQREDPQLSAIPVVVLTAVPHALNAAASLDAAEILLKPVDLPLLLDTVERYG